MRVNNPARNNPCGCEHVDHDNHEWTPQLGRVSKPRTAHRHMKVPAGEAWALWVGHICDACVGHMGDYVVKEHVHGEGDCWRGRVEMESMEMERRRRRHSGPRRWRAGRVYSFHERRPHMI